MQLLHYSEFICCLALTHREDPPSFSLRPRLLLLEESRPNSKPGSGVIFVPVLHQDSVWRRILRWFWVSSWIRAGSLGRCWARIKYRWLPVISSLLAFRAQLLLLNHWPVLMCWVCSSLYKIPIKCHHNDSSAHFSVRSKTNHILNTRVTVWTLLGMFL